MQGYNKAEKASPPIPLRGERGVICKASTRGNNKRCKVITRQTSITTMPQQGISLPSPLGEGAGVRPVKAGKRLGGEAIHYSLKT
jgi:hypothetical protein